MLLRERHGIRFWTIPAFERLGCRAVFFQRRGGVSRGECRGLNLGFNAPDDPERVRRNRLLALRSAGFCRLQPAAGMQIHGTRLRRVRRRDAGRGWLDPATAFAATDGLLTEETGLPVCVVTADCLPVLIAAEGATGVAAVHAGWRGVAGGILVKALRRFRSWWGVRPEAIWIAIGPGIGPEDFIVRDAVLAELGALYPEAVLNRRGNTAGFDLWDAVRIQARRCGVPENQVIILRENTAAHPRKYFSHRRDQGRTGRMLAVIQRDA